MTKTKTTKNILFAVLEILLIILLTIFAGLSRQMNTSKVVFLPSGGTSAIISYLSLRKFDINKLDTYVLFLLGKPQSGWIDIGTNKLSRMDFLYKLTIAKAAMKDITLIPGETSAYFLREVAREFSLNYDKLMSELEAQAPIKEGFLIPETYKVPLGISEKHLIYYIVNSSRAHHEVLCKKIFGAWNEKQWFDYIIIASIIQKEAASDDEMSLISSVIYNRLKRGMKLQMDGTLNYGLHSHEAITPERIANDNTRYNTYAYAGLPPHAICNVSFSAISAAIFPKKSDFLYFVRNKATGKHAFSKTLSGHNEEIKKSNKAEKNK